LSECVGDLVGWYEELTLDSKFVEKNMKLIDKAAKGEVGSIMQLAAAVASYTVEQAELNETLAEGRLADGNLNALMSYAQKLGEGTTAAQAFAAA
jgi:hypothetical protein